MYFRGGLQNILDVYDPANHGKYQDRIACMHEEGENRMFSAFFWRFFFPRIVHIVKLVGIERGVNKTF